MSQARTRKFSSAITHGKPTLRSLPLCQVTRWRSERSVFDNLARATVHLMPDPMLHNQWLAMRSSPRRSFEWKSKPINSNHRFLPRRTTSVTISSAHHLDISLSKSHSSCFTDRAQIRAPRPHERPDMMSLLFVTDSDISQIMRYPFESLDQ